MSGLHPGGASTAIWVASAKPSTAPSGVVLTRFRGRLISWEKGGRDADDPSTLFTRVPEADDRAGSI